MKSFLAPPLMEELKELGYATRPFSASLRAALLTHITARICQMARIRQDRVVLEDVVQTVPDSVWSQQMARAFRIFPKDIAHAVYQWADDSFREELRAVRSAVNVVYEEEVAANPDLRKDNLAVYWRCVRPGRPDAGRPHRDASFWDLEFAEGYDPRIPFRFHYLTDCIKIWIPLSGCLPSTALQVIPKSHKMDVPTIVESTEYGRRPNIHPDWLAQHEASFLSPPELSAGSCILFDMNLVHRGPRHNNPQLRISAELNFILER